MITKIALLGDICLNGKFDVKNQLDYEKYFADVAKYLSEFDYVVANLELPLTNRRFTLTCKGLHLKSSINSVEILSYLHVNVVGIANNHIFDYGDKGYKDTVSILKDKHIDCYGIKNKQVLVEHNHNKIAISGYCCFSSNPSNCNSGGVNPLNPKIVAENIEKNHKNGFLNLISMHWGDENINFPRYDHILTARYLTSVAPIIIHGNHTHVIQGIEEVDDSLVSYSQGNFCTDDVPSTAVKDLVVKQKSTNRKSFILSLAIQDNKLIKHEVIPVFDTGDKIAMIDEGISESLEEYSSKLKLDKTNYEDFRNKMLNSLHNKNSKNRNFKWYINRLNYYFIGAVIKGVLSKKRYNKVMKFILEKQ